MLDIKIAVVTGGTSFIGRELIKELCNNNISVYAIVRPDSKNIYLLQSIPNIHIILCDMSAADLWVNKIKQADVFFHLGWDGVGSKGRADADIQRDNVEKGLNCLRGAKALGCKRFLFAGSQAEYGCVDGIITENSECSPLIEYGKGKLRFLDEAMRIADGIEYVHMRIFSIYGRGDHQWALIPSCVRALYNDESISLSQCTNMWNFLHIRDAANVAMLLASRDLQGYSIFNVASTDTRILRQFVEEIYNIIKKGKLCFGTRISNAEKIIELQPSIERLQIVTGFVPQIDFSTGIRDLFEFEGEKSHESACV